ncbi:MAG: F0F1 ATP synthase subunit B [Prolixibacteraceae bacterium]|nr:F0F1 ATP synthase subunit B [Prolixibacteraceae bacterium]
MFLIPHLGTIIWTTIIFGIIFFILNKFAWPVVLKAIEDREQSIDKALVSAKEAEKKLRNLKIEEEKMIALAKHEKEQIVREGMDQREKIITAAREKAQAEADKIIEEARRQLKRERELALTEMRSQIATLSVEIASKVVHADMEDKKRHEKLVSELINEVELN